MVMVLTSTLTIMAQITTSALSGKVTTQDTKEEVIGATVQAVHVPSGTRYATVTNIDGRFTIQGMRTGGPYTVTISYVGYTTQVVKDVTLQLAETYNLPVELSVNANELTEIVVSGKASKFSAEKTGASTNINNAQIVNMPTVNEEVEHGLVFSEVHVYTGLSECAETEEHEGNTKHEVAYEALFLRIDEDNGEKESRIDEVGDIKRKPCRHNPRRQGCTNISTHNN